MAKKTEIKPIHEKLCERIWSRLEMLQHSMTCRAAEKLTTEELTNISARLRGILDAVDEYFMRIAADRKPNGRPGAAKKAPTAKKGRKRG